ncbi:MAG: hypothetical protein IT285_13335 [Bdellovibrionales bacterium]|nr:hypothetical protein [Bdellovibrionales bacterium]
MASSPARADAECANPIATSGRVDIQRLCRGDELHVITLRQNQPEESTEEIAARGHVLRDTGAWQIQNSYPNQPTLSMATSARMYFLFPRVRRPTATVLPDGGVRVRTASLMEFELDPATGLIRSMTGGTYSENAQVTTTNNAGVTLTGFDGIRLDVGYRRGAAPHERPDARSTFTDAAGRTCRVGNREIFNYIYRTDPTTGRTHLMDVVQIHQTDAALADFLSTHSAACRRLDIGVLRNPPVPLDEAVGRTLGGLDAVPGTGTPIAPVEIPTASDATETERPESPIESLSDVGTLASPTAR